MFHNNHHVNLPDIYYSPNSELLLMMGLVYNNSPYDI